MISISTILVCRATNRLSEMNVSLPTVRMCLSDSLSQDTVLLFRLYTCSQYQSQQIYSNKFLLEENCLDIETKRKEIFCSRFIKKRKMLQHILYHLIYYLGIIFLLASNIIFLKDTSVMINYLKC